MLSKQSMIVIMEELENATNYCETSEQRRPFEIALSEIKDIYHKQVTKDQLEAWMGSDDPTTLLLQVANGQYSPEQLRKDIHQYEL